MITDRSAMLLIGLVLAGTLVVGCGPVQPEPRVVSPRYFGAQPLWVCFCGYGDSPQAPPQIQSVRFRTDQGQTTLPLRIEETSRCCESGQVVYFDPAAADPPAPESIELIARLIQDGRRFRVAVKFIRQRQSRFCWRREDESVAAILLGP